MDSLRKWDDYKNSNSNTTLTTNQSTSNITNNTQQNWRQDAEFNPPRTCLHNFFIAYRAIATFSAASLGFAQFLVSAPLQL